MVNLKGWRTLAFNLLLVVGPPALVYLGGVQWDQYLNPNWAVPITGAIGIALRVVTTGPIGKK